MQRMCNYRINPGDTKTCNTPSCEFASNSALLFSTYMQLLLGRQAIYKSKVCRFPMHCHSNYIADCMQAMCCNSVLSANVY